MDLGSNIISGIAAVFLAVAAVFGFLNKKALTQEEALLGRAEANLSATRLRLQESEDAKVMHEGELATAEGTRDEHRKNKEETDLEIADGEAEIGQVKNQAATVERKLGPMRELVRQIGDIKKLIAQIDGIQTNIARLEGEVANRNETLDIAVGRLQGLNGNIDEFKALESRQRRGIPDPDFNAGVSSVHPGFGFVVLDQGNQDGLYANAQLDVMRGDEVAGQVKVNTVEQNVSVASVVVGSFGEEDFPRPGDRVVPSAVAAEAVPEGGGAVPAGAGQPDPVIFGGPGAAPAGFGAPAAPAAPAGNNPFGGMGAAPGAPAAPAPPAGNPFGAPPAAPAPAPPAGDPFGAAPAPTPEAPAPAGDAPTTNPFQ